MLLLFATSSSRKHGKCPNSRRNILSDKASLLKNGYNALCLY